MLKYDARTMSLSVTTERIAQKYGGKKQVNIAVSNPLAGAVYYVEFALPKQRKTMTSPLSIGDNKELSFYLPESVTLETGEVYIQIMMRNSADVLVGKSLISGAPIFIVEKSINAVKAIEASDDGTFLVEANKAISEINIVKEEIIEDKVNGVFNGLKGDKGDTGDTGGIGIRGIKGDTGERGAQGIKGDTGGIGIQGIKGDTGERGPQGNKGDTGGIGIQGIKGDRGERGPQGDKGDTGGVGIQGIKGDMGARGPQGDKGDTGERGIQGIKGDTGAKGDKGDKGDRGEIAVSDELGTSRNIAISQYGATTQLSKKALPVYDKFSPNYSLNWGYPNGMTASRRNDTANNYNLPSGFNINNYSKLTFFVDSEYAQGFGIVDCTEIIRTRLFGSGIVIADRPEYSEVKAFQVTIATDSRLISLKEVVLSQAYDYRLNCYKIIGELK